MKKQLIILFFIATTYRSLATDYSNQQNWAALPTMKDNADWTPNGLTNKQDSAQVDVFFIHPTTDVTGFKGNANIDNKAINNQTDDFPIKYQASVFNESCKVYAPRYRQAALHNFFTKNNEKSEQAFDVAYQDIKAAFEYYLKNYNNGKPIIIAGHSQGSMHAQRLLREYFDGKPLQNQLVEAYIIGFPTHENQFQYLKISEKADTFGGYISYSTFGMDSKIISVVPEYNNAVSVNPLDWTTNKEFVSSQENNGSLTKKSNEIVKHLFGAKNGNGIVEIQKPGEGFVPMTMKNYHIYDYSLFYINIRENVALRIKKYFEYNKIK
ncbi:MAG: DUF3089 domain-containing protein [Saprospirales bacterium]|nr:DUF3089 domain-containing protein [Saprospirales bacterium]